MKKAAKATETPGQGHKELVAVNLMYDADTDDEVQQAIWEA
jgi:hypothetical protein